MSQEASQYYHEFGEGRDLGAQFHRVIALHSEQKLPREDLLEKCPQLPAAWLELAALSVESRLEFVHDFWSMKLPYIPHCHTGVENFFQRLETIEVCLVQKQAHDPFYAHLVYGLKEQAGFYMGLPPMEEERVLDFEQRFQKFCDNEHMLPSDFLAFLSVHNGFAKCLDRGILSSTEFFHVYKKFQKNLEEAQILQKLSTACSPHHLFPFYDSFAMGSYQCFCGDWYPEQEMGNVYFSHESQDISSFQSSTSSPEEMSFPTFVDWLCFYLSSVESP